MEIEPENNMAQSAGAAEYTDCISTEGQDFPNKYPKQVTLNNQMMRFQ